jgi:hypothetical protein
MTPGELAAVIAACAATAIAGALMVLLVQARRTLREAKRALEALRGETLAAIGDLRATARRAEFELDRVDALYASAEALTSTADSASRLAYRTVTSPVVKAMALGAGTKQAIRRLRAER